ncbi:MAG: outer membrane beta-barrel protein [Proteobacteria bacterium]|nr:outer membrane beta-barrel protein [Pseudomonadota bacterium]
MKKLLLALALSTAALVPAASVKAADLPPPPVEDLRPSTYDWTGLYVGGWIGLTCIDGELNDQTQDWEMSGCGYKGGALGGYNHQFDKLVLGIEADWGRTGDIATNEEPGGDFAFSMKSLATLRARMGIALDDTLLFVTAGGAWAKGNLDAIDFTDPDNIQETHFGYTIGGGIEQALTENIRVKLDYLYTKFDGANYYSSDCAATCDIDVDDFGDHEVRLGVIWAF